MTSCFSARAVTFDTAPAEGGLVAGAVYEVVKAFLSADLHSVPLAPGMCIKVEGLDSEGGARAMLAFAGPVTVFSEDFPRLRVIPRLPDGYQERFAKLPSGTMA